MAAPTFTVVCVYNSELTLEKYLRRGLSRQTRPPELRLVDNRAGQFSNAADALNHGARSATSDYLVFIHQDVELLSPHFFEAAGAHLSKLPNVGVAGVVGARAHGNGTELVGRCLQGDASADGFTLGYDEPRAAQTVDEQLLIIARAQFEQFTFDSTACPSWDLYGVEYALGCLARGRDVWVLPLAVRHASWGKLRWPYFESLRRVQRKHPDVQALHTTCGTWPVRHSALAHWAAHRWRSARSRLRRPLTNWRRA